jgi:TRAP-type C4-dicarboxylate transport system permease small subunit
MKWLMQRSLALCAAALLAIGAIVAYEVAARYLFNAPTLWSQEISVYLLLACAFLGFAPTMHAGEHIRIDLLSRRFGPRVRSALELATCLAIAAFAAIAAWGGYETVRQSLRYGRRSLTLLAVPLWIPQLVVPLGMLLLLAVVLLRAWQAARELREASRR